MFENKHSLAFIKLIFQSNSFLKGIMFFCKHYWKKIPLLIESFSREIHLFLNLGWKFLTCDHFSYTYSDKFIILSNSFYILVLFSYLFLKMSRVSIYDIWLTKSFWFFTSFAIVIHFHQILSCIFTFLQFFWLI